MDNSGQRMVLIGAVNDEVEAGIWRDILERDGVVVFIRHTTPLSPFGVPPMPGSIQVFVPAADEKRARWLLGDRADTART